MVVFQSEILHLRSSTIVQLRASGPSTCDVYVSPSGLYTYSTTGTYFDTLVNAANCDSIITINLTVVTVNVGVTQNSAELSSVVTGGNYQWIDCNDNNSLISGANGQTYTATVNGSYAVIVTQNGCVDTSECVVVNSVGLGPIGSNGNINVYPNPTNGEVNIDLGSVQNKADISLVNVQGEIVKTWHFEETGEINLDIQESKGLYLLNISTDDGHKVIQLIKKLITGNNLLLLQLRKPLSDVQRRGFFYVIPGIYWLDKSLTRFYQNIAIVK